MQAIFEKQHQDYLSTPYLAVSERKAMIQAIRQWVKTQSSQIAEAIAQDFNHRSHDETKLLEVYPTVMAANFILKRLNRWVKPRKRHVAIQMKPASCYLQPQPKGVVGVIVPWNYPLYLALVPVISALAAGNRVMVKMSEMTPHLGELLATMCKECHIKPEKLAVINGDIKVSKQFSQLPFAHILFTGSPQIGKQIMAQASKNLTPVTLELGGKSPTIIDKSVDKKTLVRLLMGKLYNAGQTCIAPDYLFIPQDMTDEFIEIAKKFVSERYPQGTNSDDYSGIINQHHLDRIEQLSADAQKLGAKLIPLADNATGKIPLTLAVDVSDDMQVMQQEIFGPLLPIKTYTNLDDVIAYINARPNPLTLYYYGRDKVQMQRLALETLSGSLVYNESLFQAAIDDLPFGGVGNSGMGCYHGVEGFDTFSHLKPVMKQSPLSQLSIIYPPYGKLSKLFLKWVGGIN